MISIWKYDCSCFPYNPQMTEQYNASTILRSTIQLPLQILLQLYNHSTVQFNIRNSTIQTFNRTILYLDLRISFWARTVHLSVVDQLKELWLCFYYSPSTEFQVSRSSPIREKAVCWVYGICWICLSVGFVGLSVPVNVPCDSVSAN